MGSSRKGIKMGFVRRPDEDERCEKQVPMKTSMPRFRPCRRKKKWPQDKPRFCSQHYVEKTRET